jgi:nucleoside-diphosphate-sugar epimerase
MAGGSGGSDVRLFVFGMGYTAGAVVRRLAPRLQAAWGTTREAKKAAMLESAGVKRLLFDGGAHDEAISEALATASHVLVSIAPGDAGDPVLTHFRNDLAALEPQAVVYLSTVGVYGDHGGAWVDEASECRPVSARSRRRLEAEAAWRLFARETGVPVAILRLAGIYGPGRSAFDKLRDGTARRIVKPGQVFNRIHVEDIAAAVDAVFAARADGTFNVADDEPAPPQDVVACAAELLGMPPPPEAPFDTADLTPMARSFYGENKRVRNERLRRDLAVRLAFPSYREGLAAILTGTGAVSAR